MKLIAYEGASTKYTKGSTRDALILGSNTNFLTGVRLDVYMTSDNILVVMGPDGFDRIELTKEQLENTNYGDIINHNIGNKVKVQSIITLREAMSIYNNKEKELLLNLIANNKNSIMVDQLTELSSIYPDINLYVETSNNEILSYLLNSNINAKIGKIVDNNQNIIEQKNIDFYTFEYNIIDPNIINMLYINNKEIFINNVNTSEESLDLYNKLSNIFEDIFIISRKVALINSTYILEIRNRS